MRRGVYISAGLLAAATAAPAAHAADAITLTLGGRISEFFVVASQAQAAGEDLNSTSMFNDTRISVEGKTVLDNGISVRAFVRFNAVARDARDVDEAYVDVVTSFGRLRAGEKAGLNTTTIGDPVPEAFVTVDQEILGARRLYQKNKWPVIDVTRRSVEETAATIIQMFHERMDKHINNRDS